MLFREIALSLLRTSAEVFGKILCNVNTPAILEVSLMKLFTCLLRDMAYHTFENHLHKIYTQRHTKNTLSEL